MNLALPETDRCYFCDVIQGHSEPWNVLEERDLTMTLLNGRQFEVGQSIVVPVRHAPTLLDLDGPELAAVMAAARRAAEVMMKAFDPTGILLYQNNGVGSGQEVPHFHLHVVPRQPGSEWGIGPPHLARLAREGHSGRYDHTVVTTEKTAVVDLLRNEWGAG